MEIFFENEIYLRIGCFFIYLNKDQTFIAAWKIKSCEKDQNGGNKEFRKKSFREKIKQFDWLLRTKEWRIEILQNSFVSISDSNFMLRHFGRSGPNLVDDGMSFPLQSLESLVVSETSSNAKRRRPRLRRQAKIADDADATTKLWKCFQS